MHLYKQAVQTVKLVNVSPCKASSVVSPDYAASLLFFLAEILTMRERAAANAVLGILQIAVGFFSNFLDRSV